MYEDVQYHKKSEKCTKKLKQVNMSHPFNTLKHWEEYGITGTLIHYYWKYIGKITSRSNLTSNEFEYAQIYTQVSY